MALLCRKQPSRPYRFCGRLEAVAIVHPKGEEEEEEEEEVESEHGLRKWVSDPLIAPHLIFRLIEEEEGTTSSVGFVEEVFGAVGIGMMRPERIQQQRWCVRSESGGRVRGERASVSFARNLGPLQAVRGGRHVCRPCPLTGPCIVAGDATWSVICAELTKDDDGYCRCDRGPKLKGRKEGRRRRR